MDASQQKHFLKSTKLGHPLIRADVRVCNDFSIEKNGDVVLVTGSNMSGKSTFLRTVGINLVLAYAGAPVIAEQFSAAVFRLFCCIQVNDSLTDGVSQFYQEVKRLKRIHEKIGKPDDVLVFILIDEIFKGTNNRERLIGSRAYIKELTKSHALAVISTHDIELTQLDHIRNVHFREHVEAGRLAFDYKLHDGPCPTTNALEIMRLEGLPVNDASSE
jgi:DNA mismatch repair ATPase MutS